ncbi:MAG: DUF3592 domain-containing protein [Lentisphaerae bacterium]|nr:DUF3592 domain-containing protein [Lentisphaerota bacterium]
MEQERLINFVNDRPLNNGKSWERVLDTRDPDCWRFRLSRTIWALYIFLLSVPLAAGFSGSWGTLIFSLIFIFFILFILAGSAKEFYAVPTFDFRNGCFYRDWKKPRYGDVSTLKGYLPFSKISGIQLFYKVVHRSKGPRQIYELNLITDDLNRIFVTDSSNYAYLRENAEKLSQKLNIPITENDKHKTKEKTVPRWVAVLFLIIFSGAGTLGAIQNIISPLIQNSRTEKWLSVPAEVTNSYVKTARRRSKHSSYTVYKAEITFKYDVKGKSYTSDTYSFFHDFSRSSYKHRQLVKKFVPGKKINCYCNPDDPRRAVIDKKIPAAELVAESGAYLFFIAVGAGVFILLWSQRKK